MANPLFETSSLAAGREIPEVVLALSVCLKRLVVQRSGSLHSGAGSILDGQAKLARRLLRMDYLSDSTQQKKGRSPRVSAALQTGPYLANSPSRFLVQSFFEATIQRTDVVSYHGSGSCVAGGSGWIG